MCVWIRSTVCRVRKNALAQRFRTEIQIVPKVRNARDVFQQPSRDSWFFPSLVSPIRSEALLPFVRKIYQECRQCRFDVCCRKDPVATTTTGVRVVGSGLERYVDVMAVARGRRGVLRVPCSKDGNVVKTIRINHPPNHRFYRCYKPFPNGRFMELF